jgi:hypothetical protein
LVKKKKRTRANNIGMKNLRSFHGTGSTSVPVGDMMAMNKHNHCHRIATYNATTQKNRRGISTQKTTVNSIPRDVKGTPLHLIRFSPRESSSAKHKTLMNLNLLFSAGPPHQSELTYD